MTYRMGELTARQATEAFAARPTILLPLGSHESHGPALPMGDYLAAERIGLAIAERAGQAGLPCLVAPPLPFGGADYFGSVPGAIALSQTTLRAVLADLFAALLRHGLTRLVVLNGHGGNCAAIHETTLAIRHAHGAIIPSLYLWKVARALLDERLGSAEAAAHAGHGREPLASITRHLLARLDTPLPPPPASAESSMLGLPVADFATVAFQGVQIDMPLEYDQIGPASGPPPHPLAAHHGAWLTDRLVEIGAALVAHLAARP